MTDLPSRGSRMAENESFAMLMDSLRRAEECARQLAHHRGDLRWIKVARSYHENQVLVSRLIASSLMGGAA
jgi:hypothetical protein